MRVFKTINSTRKHIASLKRQDKLVGLVPTMGYLHQGHLSLVRQAKKDCDIVVVSIFVNPLQFGPKEDLKKYPRDIKRDCQMLEREEVDALFYPSAKDMYKGEVAFIDVGRLGNILCGKTRPGHFRGVATVVNKLFNIIQPDISYFGQKDSQQLTIIKKMVSDLNISVKIKGMPIVRERSGLAMSSRNSYLTDKEKQDALVLYKSLKLAKALISGGQKNSLTIKDKMRKLIDSIPSVKIDYIEIVNPDNLEPLDEVTGKVLIMLAVWVGKTRLIDNILC